MSYYGKQWTKEQREAIAPYIKEIRRIQKLQNSSDKVSSQMELISIRFRGNVPKVSKKPQLSDYGLPENVESIIEEEKREIAQKEKKRQKNIKLKVLFAFALFILIEILFIPEDTFAAVLLTLTVLLIVQMAISYHYDEMRGKTRKCKVEYEDNYNRFLDDSRAFVYWDTMQHYNYWNSLDGHSFERAVAALYRSLGFDAVVSKEGGDGGVDILLKKDDDDIVVQCKAHSKAVTPTVARDLYGTMVGNNYSKGIIVSKNGFTKGVYEFVKGKNIELVDLDMLLRIQQSI